MNSPFKIGELVCDRSLVAKGVGRVITGVFSVREARVLDSGEVEFYDVPKVLTRWSKKLNPFLHIYLFIERLERLSEEDVALRVISGDEIP